jgi:hypothetical protein
MWSPGGRCHVETVLAVFPADYLGRQIDRSSSHVLAGTDGPGRHPRGHLDVLSLGPDEGVFPDHGAH